MILKIDGTITGSINDAEVKACASGFLDTSGNELNHFELTFIEPIPPGFNPIVAGGCWASSYHGNATKPLTIAGRTPSNLFAMHDGAYITSRTVDPIDDESVGLHLQFDSSVEIQGGVIHTTKSTVTGYYKGPTDIIGVGDYEQEWKEGRDSTSVDISITAKLIRATGSPIPIKIETKYSGLNSQNRTIFPTQRARHFYGNQIWNGRVMSFDWVGILYA